MRPKILDILGGRYLLVRWSLGCHNPRSIKRRFGSESRGPSAATAHAAHVGVANAVSISAIVHYVLQCGIKNLNSSPAQTVTRPVHHNGVERASANVGRNYLLFTLFLVLYTGEVIGIGFSILPGLSFKNACVYIIVGYLAISTVAQGGVVSARFPSFIAWFVFLILYALVTMIVCSLVYSYYDAVFHGIGFKNFWIDPFLFFAVFFFGCATSEDAIWLARRICLLVAISSIILLLDFLNIVPFGFVNTVGGRFNGGVGGSNQYAAFLNFFVFAMSPMALSRNRSLIVVLGIVASLILLLETGSRGALVGLVLGSIMMTFVLRRHISAQKALKVAVIALAGLAVVAVAAYVANPEMLLGRVEDTRSANTLNTLSTGRLVTWVAALQTMAERPYTFLTGMGWDMFVHARIYTDPHNHYLYLLYSLGAIGLGLFGALMAGFVRCVVSVLGTVDETTKRYLLGFLYGLAALLGSLLFAVLYSPWFFIYPYIGLMTKLAWLERNRRTAEVTSEPAGRAIPALRVGP